MSITTRLAIIIATAFALASSARSDGISDFNVGSSDGISLSKIGSAPTSSCLPAPNGLDFTNSCDMIYIPALIH
jgi:Ca2+-binding RTX toxin-like protein